MTKQNKNLLSDDVRLIGEWNWSKNDGIAPNKITCGSMKKVWWRCEKGHEWEATIYNRVKGSNCPYCSGRRPIAGVNAFATMHPKLLDEWKCEKNKKAPNEYTQSSGASVWWICKEGHEWEATICHRVKGTGCPYCAGRRVLQGYNDLSSLRPEIAKEWHPHKNGEISVSNVTFRSGKKYGGNV